MCNSFFSFLLITVYNKTFWYIFKFLFLISYFCTLYRKIYLAFWMPFFVFFGSLFYSREGFFGSGICYGSFIHWSSLSSFPWSRALSVVATKSCSHDFFFSFLNNKNIYNITVLFGWVTHSHIRCIRSHGGLWDLDKRVSWGTTRLNIAPLELIQGRKPRIKSWWLSSYGVVSKKGEWLADLVGNFEMDKWLSMFTWQ